MLMRQTDVRTWQISHPARCACCRIRLRPYRAALPPVCAGCARLASVTPSGIATALGSDWKHDEALSTPGVWIFVTEGEPEDEEDEESALLVDCVEVVANSDGTYDITPSGLTLDENRDQVERPEPAGEPVFDVAEADLLTEVRRVAENIE
jgi:hypothetical protein